MLPTLSDPLDFNDGRIPGCNRRLQQVAVYVGIPQPLIEHLAGTDDEFGYDLLAEIITCRSSLLDLRIVRRELNDNLKTLKACFGGRHGLDATVDDGSDLTADFARCLRKITSRGDVQLIAITCAFFTTSSIDIGMPSMPYESDISIYENNLLVAKHFERVWTPSRNIADTTAEPVFLPRNAMSSMWQHANRLIFHLHLVNNESLVHYNLLSRHHYLALQTTLAHLGRYAPEITKAADAYVSIFAIYCIDLPREQRSGILDTIRKLYKGEQDDSRPLEIQCLRRVAGVILSSSLTADTEIFLQEALSKVPDPIASYLTESLLKIGLCPSALIDPGDDTDIDNGSDTEDDTEIDNVGSMGDGGSLSQSES